MAKTTSLTGDISSSSTGTDLYHLIETATKPYQASLAISGAVSSALGFGDVFDAVANGQRSWTGSFSGRYPAATPSYGNTGLVTFASGYVTNVRSWSMSITAGVEDTSDFGDWATAAPGVISWTGSWECIVDDTTALSGALPTVGGTAAASATFRLKDSATDGTLAGNILVNSVTPNFARGSPNLVTFGFSGSGTLASAGTNSLFPSGNLDTPDIATIVLTAAAGRTYTGSAFWTNVNVTVPYNGLVDIGVSFQGTGALTGA